MGRLLPLLLAPAALALLAPSAPARVMELGAEGGRLPKPSCPGNPCLAVTRTTGFQTTAGQRRNVFAAPAAGRVVAVTLSLGRPNATQVGFFNRQGGGPARVAVAVLRPATGSTATSPRYLLNAQSTEFALERHFGTTVQFPLYTSLLVRRGDIVALSVPTWAPVLAVSDLANTFTWRASRMAPCSTNPERQPPHVMPGSTRVYFCLYRPAQLAYSVTLVTLPGAGTTAPPPSANNDDGGANNGSGGGSGDDGDRDRDRDRDNDNN